MVGRLGSSCSSFWCLSYSAALAEFGGGPFYETGYYGGGGLQLVLVIVPILVRFASKFGRNAVSQQTTFRANRRHPTGGFI